MHKVTLWDENALRLMEAETNLRIVMHELGIVADVQLNSEPPLLARHGVNGKTPALQVDDGDIWTYSAKQSVDVEGLRSLLLVLIERRIL